MKAGRKCGNNMAYKIVDKVKYADGVSLEPLCILECTCVSEQYEKKDGQCIKKNDIPKQKEVSFKLNFMPKYTKIQQNCLNNFENFDQQML